MPAVGDVIELVHEQLYLGQTVNNVSYWQSNDAGSSLTALAAWYETNVVAAVANGQCSELTHVNLRLRNLFLDAETYEEPLTGAGAIACADTELPSFVAVSIRFDHVQGGLRPGFKRFAAINEAHISNALLIAGIITLYDTVGSYFVQPPPVANTGWVPVIVKRVCEIPNPTPGESPICLKYRLPETQGELITGVPTSFEVNPQPTTQNSRKYYT